MTCMEAKRLSRKKEKGKFRHLLITLGLCWRKLVARLLLCFCPCITHWHGGVIHICLPPFLTLSLVCWGKLQCWMDLSKRNVANGLNMLAGRLETTKPVHQNAGDACVITCTLCESLEFSVGLSGDGKEMTWGHTLHLCVCLFRKCVQVQRFTDIDPRNISGPDSWKSIRMGCSRLADNTLHWCSTCSALSYAKTSYGRMETASWKHRY